MGKRPLSMSWFKIQLVGDQLPNPNTPPSSKHQLDPDQGLLEIREMSNGNPLYKCTGIKLIYYRTITVNMCQIESERVSNSRFSCPMPF